MNRASKCNTGLILSFALTTVSAHATTIDPLAFQNLDSAGRPASAVQTAPIPASTNPGDSPHLSENSTRTDDDAPNADLTYFTAAGMSGDGMNLIDPVLFSSLDVAPDFAPAAYFVSIIAGLGIGGPQLPPGEQRDSPSGPVPEPQTAVLTGTGLLALMWALQKRRSHLRTGAILC
jgi:hypothetical protein